ncbi:MAG: hypothetical protein O4806_04420 [Trichodesmium sp. St5_bin8]|nr:hypothetical protein [Trichodesmium sp. St5_bin8]
MFIYISFAMLAQHWLPFLILGGFFALIFIPNILKKDKSLSRYLEFTEDKTNSGLIIPQLWGDNFINQEAKKVSK